MTNTESLRIEMLQDGFKKHPHILKQLLKSEDLHNFPLYKLKILPTLYTNYKKKANYLKLAIHEYKSIEALYNSLLLINNQSNEVYDFYNLETELKIEFLNEYKIQYELCNESGYLFIYPDSFNSLNLLAKKLWCISRQFHFYKKYGLDDRNTQFVIFCKIDDVESFNGLTINKNKTYIVCNKKNQPTIEIPASIVNKFQLKEKRTGGFIFFVAIIYLATCLNIPVLNIILLFILLSLTCIFMNENCSLKIKLKNILLRCVTPLLLSTIIVQPHYIQPHYFNQIIHKNPFLKIVEPFHFQINNPFSFIKQELPDTFLTELYKLDHSEDGIVFLKNQKELYRLVLKPEHFKTLYKSQYYEYIAFFIKERALTADTINVITDTVVEQEDTILLELLSKNDSDVNIDIHKELYHKIVTNKKFTQNPIFIEKFKAFVNDYIKKHG